MRGKGGFFHFLVLELGVGEVEGEADHAEFEGAVAMAVLDELGEVGPDL